MLYQAGGSLDLQLASGTKNPRQIIIVRKKFIVFFPNKIKFFFSMTMMVRHVASYDYDKWISATPPLPSQKTVSQLATTQMN